MTIFSHNPLPFPTLDTHTNHSCKLGIEIQRSCLAMQASQRLSNSALVWPTAADRSLCPVCRGFYNALQRWSNQLRHRGTVSSSLFRWAIGASADCPATSTTHPGSCILPSGGRIATRRRFPCVAVCLGRLRLTNSKFQTCFVKKRTTKVGTIACNFYHDSQFLCSFSVEDNFLEGFM